MTLRRFGLSACTTNPEDQTLHHWHSTDVLTTFYIVITFLSGHTLAIKPVGLVRRLV